MTRRQCLPHALIYPFCIFQTWQVSIEFICCIFKCMPLFKLFPENVIGQILKKCGFYRLADVNRNGCLDNFVRMINIFGRDMVNAVNATNPKNLF